MLEKLKSKSPRLAGLANSVSMILDVAFWDRDKLVTDNEEQLVEALRGPYLRWKNLKDAMPANLTEDNCSDVYRAARVIAMALVDDSASELEKKEKLLKEIPEHILSQIDSKKTVAELSTLAKDWKKESNKEGLNGLLTYAKAQMVGLKNSLERDEWIEMNGKITDRKSVM